MKLVFVLSFFIFSARSVHADMKLQLVKCAQTIADLGHGGDRGIKTAARMLEAMSSNQREMVDIVKECKSYVKSHKVLKPDREHQVQVVSELRGELSHEVYFFLRSAVRPLIACKKTANLFRSCTSATGKRWLEITLKNGINDRIDFRIGHTDGGLMVKGPQNYLNQEDIEYLATLPSKFAHGAEESIRKDLNRNYLKMKVFKKAGTNMFLRHYFL